MSAITLKPTLKQHKAWEYLNDLVTKYLLFGGGAGGGKSWLGCEWLLTMCYRYPGTKWFIGREELKRLMASTYVTFRKVCKHHKIPDSDWKLNGQYNYIEFKNGSRIDLLDLKELPGDLDYERFGSLEYTGGWIEEASEIAFKAFDVLKSRVGRQLNKEYGIKSKILLTCNPKQNWLYRLFYKPWKKKLLPEKFAFVQSLYGDNEHTAEEYEENLSEITDIATKQRLKYGNWEYDSDPATMIDFDSISDLFTNTVEESNDKYMVVDVARYGHDKTVISYWKGLEVYKWEEYIKQGTDQTEQKIRDGAHSEQIPFSHIVIDEDGIGGGVVDHLPGVKGFINNGTPFDNPKTGKPDNFQNLKTQCYYKLAEIAVDHGMAVKGANPQQQEWIAEELAQVKTKDADKDGKRRIVPKEEVKDLLGRSPDYSDNLMMRMYFEFSKPGAKALPDPVFEMYGTHYRD